MNGKNNRHNNRLDFIGETEEDIEDSNLEGPWTRCGPSVLAKEFHRLT